MESLEFEKESKDKKEEKKSGFMKYIYVLMAIFGSILYIFNYNLQTRDFGTRTHNRHPTIQRRNAFTEDEIQKVLHKLKEFNKYSDNLRKNN